MLCRDNIFDLHKQKCTIEGTPLVEGALAMEYEEYKYTQTVFFRQEKFEEAAFCGLDQAMTGRLSEGIDGFWSMFKVHPSLFHLQCTWYRGKTKTVCDDINIFPSLESPEYCSIHALASLAGMRQDINEKVFCNIGGRPLLLEKKKDTHNSVSHKINESLKGIKQVYDEDSNVINKPAMYRAGLTSHSIRHTGINMLNRSSHIKEEWREMRTQHTNLEKRSHVKSVKNAYIKFNYVTDAPCGKCLANHKSLFYESKCPYINAVPLTDQNSFHMFTIEFFVSISFVDISVRYLFSCILITWFNYNVEKYPNSSLVKRMISVAEKIPGFTLVKISTVLKHYFEEQHYFNLPMTVLSHEQSGAIIADTLTTTSSALQHLQHDMREIKSSHMSQASFTQSQASFNQCVLSKLDRLESHQVDIITEIKNISSSTYSHTAKNKKRKLTQSGMSLFYSSSAQQTQTLAAVSEQCTISETTFSMDDQNTTTYNNNEHSKAIHQQKFKITDIKSVLFLWYTTPLFKFPLANLTTDEKSLLHKCSKVVTYMKCFIPSTCDLFSQQVSSTDDDYNQWLDNLHILCNNTQELVMSFIDTKHFEKYGTNLNPLVKHKARFDATYKILETISKLEFPNNVALSDVIFTPATSLHPYYSSINQWETKKKSL